MSDEQSTRRGLLRGVGVAGALSIGGCLGGGDTPTPTETETLTPLGGPTDTPTETAAPKGTATVRFANLALEEPSLSVFIVGAEETAEPGGGGLGPGPSGPGGSTPGPGPGGSTPGPGPGPGPGSTPTGSPTETPTVTPTPGIGGATDTPTPTQTQTPTPSDRTPTTTPERAEIGERVLELGEVTDYAELQAGGYTLLVESEDSTLFESTVVIRDGDYTLAIFDQVSEATPTDDGADAGTGGGTGEGADEDGGIRPALLTDDRSTVPDDAARFRVVNGVRNTDDIDVFVDSRREITFLEHQESDDLALEPGQHTIEVRGSDGPLGVFDVEVRGGEAYTLFGSGTAPVEEQLTTTPTTESTGTPERSEYRDTDEEDDDDDDEESITPILTGTGGSTTATSTDVLGETPGEDDLGTETPTPSAQRLFRPTVANDVGDAGGLTRSDPQIRLANLAPRVPRATIEVDGAALKRGLRFRRVSDYTTLPSQGSKSVVLVRSGSGGEPLLERPIYLGGGRYTVATVDGVGRSDGDTTVHFHGAGIAPDSGRRATLGAIHAVPDVENVAVSLAGQTDSAIRRLPKGSFRSATVDAGQRVVELRRRGEQGRGEILASAAVDLDAQTAETILATGYENPGDSAGSGLLSLSSVLDDGQPRRNPLLLATSDAFNYGAEIPTVHTCDGEDRSPPLTIRDVPGRAESLAILVDDPDAGTQPFVHWTCWNLPTDVGTIPADQPTGETLGPLGGARQGQNDADSVGYTGPCPPEGDDPHQYRFVVFALDTTLDLEAGADPQAFRSAIEGHVVHSTLLTGTYGR